MKISSQEKLWLKDPIFTEVIRLIKQLIEKYGTYYILEDIRKYVQPY